MRSMTMSSRPPMNSCDYGLLSLLFLWVARPIFTAQRTYLFLTRIPRIARHGRMSRRLAVVLVVVVSGLASPQAAAAGQTPTPLARKLAKALQAPHVAQSRTGALAVDLATGLPVYSHNLTLPLIPASNEKLAVTYAALHAFGPAYRFETQVVAEGEQEGALWRGDLVLKGYGDPTLSSLRLNALAAQIRGYGITRVTGRLVGDESFFDSKRTAPGWKSWFFINESPPLSALTADRGRYRGRTSGNPAQAAAELFREALLAAGVSITGRTVVGKATDGALPLASSSSLPLLHVPSLHEPGERQLHRGGAAQASGDAAHRPGDDVPPGRLSSARS